MSQAFAPPMEDDTASPSPSTTMSLHPPADMVYLDPDAAIEDIKRKAIAEGFALTTRRSKKDRDGRLSLVSFVCEKATYRHPSATIRKTSVKGTGCTFSAALRRRRRADGGFDWRFDVSQPMHNHGPADPTQHRSRLRLTDEQRVFAVALHTAKVKRKEILERLLERWPDCPITTVDLGNQLAQAKIKEKKLQQRNDEFAQSVGIPIEHVQGAMVDLTAAVEAHSSATGGTRTSGVGNRMSTNAVMPSEMQIKTWIVEAVHASLTRGLFQTWVIDAMQTPVIQGVIKQSITEAVHTSFSQGTMRNWITEAMREHVLVSAAPHIPVNYSLRDQVMAVMGNSTPAPQAQFEQQPPG